MECYNAMLEVPEVIWVAVSVCQYLMWRGVGGRTIG
jgi:hypothetical protein